MGLNFHLPCYAAFVRNVGKKHAVRPPAMYHGSCRHILRRAEER